MSSTLFILLLSLTAAFGAWGLARLFISLVVSDRHRIQARLSSEYQGKPVSALHRPVTVATPVQGLPPGLAKIRLVQALHRRLLHSYPDTSLPRFLMLTMTIAALGFVTGMLLMDSCLAGMVAGLVGVYLPIVFINQKRARRQRTLAEQLPEALDFLCRVLRAGHSLSTGIQMMGQELPSPIGAEFRRCYDQHSLGQSLDEALREMAGRIASSDFAFFVTAVLIQRQTGGDLSEVLANISTMIRNRIRLQQHVKAITAEGRYTGYILVAFPILLFVISFTLNPDYAGVLLRTSIGKTLLGAAFTLQVIGLMVIRKIVNVKV